MAIIGAFAAASPAHARCGDVTGDDQVTTSDALAVLKESVGQNPDLTCQDDLVVDNDVGFANQLECFGHDFVAKMRWSEHPDLVWKAETEYYLPLEPEYFEVDDLFIGGEIEVRLDDCGTVEFDLDDWEIVYPMPAVGAAFFYLDYEYDTDTLFLFLHLAPLDVEDGLSGGGSAGQRPTPSRVMLGSRPAPKGISRAPLK
ncbi:MAG TPA: hypothetical protein VEC57_09525 [Candidatus Limnocylindrales bacterium]|nr:hypothetical protein [Candidatus Limnocylindrales bacterium]